MDQKAGAEESRGSQDDLASASIKADKHLQSPVARTEDASCDAIPVLAGQDSPAHYVGVCFNIDCNSQAKRVPLGAWDAKDPASDMTATVCSECGKQYGMIYKVKPDAKARTDTE